MKSEVNQRILSAMYVIENPEGNGVTKPAAIRELVLV